MAREVSVDVEGILSGMALGDDVMDKKVVETLDGKGNLEATVRTGVQRHVGPSLAALRELAAMRVGGPRDWC